MLRRSRPRVLRLLALVLAAGALAACGTSGPAGQAGVTVWALQDTVLNPIEQQSVDRFTRAGGAAKLETFGNDPYKQKLRVALGSPNPPSAFFNWGGGNLKEYVDAGKVADLTPLLAEHPGLGEAFLPNVLDAARLDGKLYGLPMRGMQPVVLFYNKEVFAAAGARPPGTWDELLALVETFKARNVQPIALAGSQAWTELMWAEYLLDRIGGPEVFRAVKGNPEGWRHPAVLESMTRLKDLIDRGGFGRDFAGVGYDLGGASTILAQGKAAMHLMGSWEYVNQLGQSPEFVKRDALGWVPFPALPGGKGDPRDLVGNPANFYSVAAGSSTVDQAKKFVATQLHDPAYVQALIDAGDVPAVTGLAEQLAKAPNAAYTGWLYDRVRAAPHFQLSWDQDLPAEQATFLLTQLQEFFLGKLSPRQFADALASRG
ncbi:MULTISPECIES: extracellular solute-binding protein [unclassified Crossiella]|uniref:extracellular solute-binding protein n=1 Tax=unclassified Crossiella TaxID=2620835 RepID=UPI001FFE99C6|nr:MULTISPECIES: extracellular solute-binding protein [unclassified Crossiella]MCK2244994.1 extracellular solute-binding protein [Crossiella sp. S99.2]MCK2258719.1 extracellular solute-binding protein [Crossiella sp. S99.1]